MCQASTRRDTALLVHLRAIAAYIRLAIPCSFSTLYKYYTIFFIVFQIGDDDGGLNPWPSAWQADVLAYWTTPPYKARKGRTHPVCFAPRRSHISHFWLIGHGKSVETMVRMMGLEPIRSYEHEHLKLACLPIPAHAHISMVLIEFQGFLF